MASSSRSLSARLSTPSRAISKGNTNRRNACVGVSQTGIEGFTFAVLLKGKKSTEIITSPLLSIQLLCTCFRPCTPRPLLTMATTTHLPRQVLLFTSRLSPLLSCFFTYYGFHFPIVFKVTCRIYMYSEIIRSRDPAQVRVACRVSRKYLLEIDHQP